MPSVHVGGLVVDHQTALDGAKNYVSGASHDPPYSFPAYDEMVTGSEPGDLNDGDLLAPTLLNVRVSVRAFYGLQQHRSKWELDLSFLDADLDLEKASPQVLKDVAGLF